jgi:hypothetical protein
MTVLPKPSANGMFGGLRLTAVLGAALSALVAVAVVGCSGGGGGSVSAAKSAQAVRSSHSAASASANVCSSWAGLGALYSVTTSLRQMIGDEVIFGTGTAEANKDGLAVVVDVESLDDGVLEQLPPTYASDVRGSVLSVADSPYEKTPEQLNTAANNAMSLATKIGKLCLPAG